MIPHPQLNSGLLLQRAIAAADPECQAEHEKHSFAQYRQLKMDETPCPVCLFLDLCLEHPAGIAAIVVGELVAVHVPLPTWGDFEREDLEQCSDSFGT